MRSLVPPRFSVDTYYAVSISRGGGRRHELKRTSARVPRLRVVVRATIAKYLERQRRGCRRCTGYDISLEQNPAGSVGRALSRLVQAVSRCTNRPNQHTEANQPTTRLDWLFARVSPSSAFYDRARAHTHTHTSPSLSYTCSLSLSSLFRHLSPRFFFSCSCWCVRASASLLAPALERALYKYTRNARSRLHRTTCTQEAFRRKSRARVPDYFPLASRRAPAPGTHNFSFGRARPNLTLLLRGSGSSNELKIIRFTINLFYNIIYIIYNWMIYSGFAGTRSKWSIRCSAQVKKFHVWFYRTQGLRYVSIFIV